MTFAQGSSQSSLGVANSLSHLNKTPMALQTLATPPDQAPARDIYTYREDEHLVNACWIANENKKEHCLCVARVLKYELILREYKVASALYSAEQSLDPHALGSVQSNLKTQGYSEDEIKAVTKLYKRLLEPENLKIRCKESSQYFKKK